MPPLEAAQIQCCRWHRLASQQRTRFFGVAGTDRFEQLFIQVSLSAVCACGNAGELASKVARREATLQDLEGLPLEQQRLATLLASWRLKSVAAQVKQVASYYRTIERIVG